MGKCNVNPSKIDLKMGECDFDARQTHLFLHLGQENTRSNQVNLYQSHIQPGMDLIFVRMA